VTSEPMMGGDDLPRELPLPEFAKWAGLSDETVRRRFKDGSLRGRRDARGLIWITIERLPGPTE
jgi:hypothetical protein